jgi:hypothetical protein
MAGSDKVDPAVPCLLWVASALGGGLFIPAQAGAAILASRVSNQIKKC